MKILNTVIIILFVIISSFCLVAKDGIAFMGFICGLIMFCLNIWKDKIIQDQDEMIEYLSRDNLILTHKITESCDENENEN